MYGEEYYIICFATGSYRFALGRYMAVYETQNTAYANIKSNSTGTGSSMYHGSGKNHSRINVLCYLALHQLSLSPTSPSSASPVSFTFNKAPFTTP